MANTNRAQNKRQRQRQPQRPLIVLHVPEPKKAGSIWRANFRVELNENNRPLLGARGVFVEFAGSKSRVLTDSLTGTVMGWLEFSRPGGYTVTAYREDDTAIRTSVDVFVVEETKEAVTLRRAQAAKDIAEARQATRAAQAPSGKGARAVVDAKQQAEIAQAEVAEAEAHHKLHHVGGTPEQQNAQAAKFRLEEAEADHTRSLIGGTQEERDAQAAKFLLERDKAAHERAHLGGAPQEQAAAAAEADLRTAKALHTAEELVVEKLHDMSCKAVGRVIFCAIVSNKGRGMKGSLLVGAVDGKYGKRVETGDDGILEHEVPIDGDYTVTLLGTSVEKSVTTTGPVAPPQKTLKDIWAGVGAKVASRLQELKDTFK